MVAAAIIAATSLQAQTERSDNFRAKYELKEVVVMSRHNIRSPLTSGGAAYMRVTPYEWFKWTSPSSQLSQRGGVLETEMGQFFRKWVVSAGLLPDIYRPVDERGAVLCQLAPAHIHHGEVFLSRFPALCQRGDSA